MTEVLSSKLSALVAAALLTWPPETLEPVQGWLSMDPWWRGMLISALVVYALWPTIKER